MSEPDVFEIVGRYLRGKISQRDLRFWLAGHLEWIDREAASDQRDLALMAQQLDFLVQDGEMTEAGGRDELRREYRSAGKQRASLIPPGAEAATGRAPPPRAAPDANSGCPAAGTGRLAAPRAPTAIQRSVGFPRHRPSARRGWSGG